MPVFKPETKPQPKPEVKPESKPEPKPIPPITEPVFKNNPRAGSEKPEVPSGDAWDGAGDAFIACPELASLAGVARVHAGTLPTARSIGELALPRLANGEGVVASEALPLYVRHRVALTESERSAGAHL